MIEFIYRPEREEPSRLGGRYLGDIRIAPGINQFEGRHEKAIKDYFASVEGNELLRKTVYEVLESQIETEVSEASLEEVGTTQEFIAEPQVTIVEEKPKRASKKKVESEAEKE